ncbi:MAG: AbrB/MazE/SpoVT family DNA-binding domain-containing protein, partial [Chloroflexota bacterium]
EAVQPSTPLDTLLLDVPRLVGEVTLTGKNQLTLPAEGIRAVGWERGDRILVRLIAGDRLLLMRCPTDWAAYYAGKLGEVFGSHEETIAYLEEERRSWDDE